MVSGRFKQSRITRHRPRLPLASECAPVPRHPDCAPAAVPLAIPMTGSDAALADAFDVRDVRAALVLVRSRWPQISALAAHLAQHTVNRMASAAC